jgi:hypothetical protein
MTTANETSAVVFTDDGAIYRPGNGHTIEYRKVGGIYYHVQTPDAVIEALESARSRRQRVRIYLGDAKTGRDWLEECDVTGYIGNSLGPLRVPLLINNRRSTGGSALLDHCIVKIKVTSGTILYQHPSYHLGTFTIREITSGNELRAKGYSHAVDLDNSNHANFKSLAAAEKNIRRMTT